MARRGSVTLSLPSDMLDHLGRICKAERRTRSQLVREALTWYLNRLPVEQPTPEEIAAIEEGREAIARGEHVTLDETIRALGVGPRPTILT